MSQNTKAPLLAFLLLLGSASWEASARGFQGLADQAEAARLSGRTAEALALYREALVTRQDWSEGWWHLARLSYDAGQFEESRNALRRLVLLEPSSFRGRALLGLSEFQLREFDFSLQSLLQALGSNPVEDRELYLQVRLHAALLLTRAQQFEESFFLLFDLAYQIPGDEMVILGLGIAALHLPFLPDELPVDRLILAKKAGEVLGLLADFRLDRSREAYQDLLREYPEVEAIASANPDHLITGGPKEGFPPSFAREVVPADEANLDDEDLILGVLLEGRARAYPVNYMNGPLHEVVNDRLGDRNLAATW